MIKKPLASALFFAAATLLSGCVIHVGDASALDNEDLSSIFGNIDIAEHRHAGNISSVNGNVEIKDNASADDVSIVNGNLDMGSHVRVYNIDIVNGDVTAESHVQVARDVNTVNGDITLPNGSKVDNNVASVNGDIDVFNTLIGKDLETVNGDITLTGDTTIGGNIVYKERDSNWIERKNSQPQLHIGEQVKVLGNIILERPVVLKFDNPTLHEKVIVSYPTNK